MPGIFILNHTQYIYIKVFHYLLWYDVMLQLTRQKWESETLALSAAQIISYQDFYRWAKYNICIINLQIDKLTVSERTISAQGLNNAKVKET